LKTKHVTPSYHIAPTEHSYFISSKTNSPTVIRNSETFPAKKLGTSS